jgi:exosome complex component RRP42
MIIEESYILNKARKGERIDKRKADEFRKLEIEYSPIEKPEGCAKVTLGETVVMAGVKLGLGTPFNDRPDEGVLMVNAELSPLSSPSFETGPPSERAIELARVVDRGIRESKCIDLKKLCIEKGEKVWMVNVDVHVLNHRGNLLDAAGIAAMAALRVAVFPEFDGEEINYDKKTKKKLPVSDAVPIPVTFVKVEDGFFMDPSLEEEQVMGARLTVTTKKDGNIVAMQKGGSEAITQEEAEKAFDLSAKKGKEFRKLVK